MSTGRPRPRLGRALFIRTGESHCTSPAVTPPGQVLDSWPLHVLRAVPRRWSQECICGEGSPGIVAAPGGLEHLGCYLLLPQPAPHNEAPPGGLDDDGCLILAKELLPLGALGSQVGVTAPWCARLACVALAHALYHPRGQRLAAHVACARAGTHKHHCTGQAPQPGTHRLAEGAGLWMAGLEAAVVGG